MKSIKYVFPLLIAIAFACAKKGPEMVDPVIFPKEFKFSSTAFQNDSFIPKKYTCDSDNVSPELKWENAPAGTKSFVLIMEDPDAPNDTFIHWVVYDIPPAVTTLQEHMSNDEIFANGTKQGRNSAGMNKYTGPCPPSGMHRYFFTLYAVDTTLGVGNYLAKDYKPMIKKHIIKQAQIIGKYQR